MEDQKIFGGIYTVNGHLQDLAFGRGPLYVGPEPSVRQPGQVEL